MVTCEVPGRSWQEALTPKRIGLGMAALVAIVVGLFTGDLLRIGLTALGAALLLSAVLLPTIREVEFGFPLGVKVKTAIRDREETLRQTFQEQKGGLELVAQLLCDEPEVAGRLLEAAWSHAAAAWRGPAGPGLREYVLCETVRLVVAHRHWGAPHGASPTTTPLSVLDTDERIAVVLHEFAGLTLGQIASMTGREVADVGADLRRGIGRSEAQYGTTS